MVLMVTALDFSSPHSRATNITTFTKKKVARLYFETRFFYLSKVHLVELIQIELIPENILGTKKRPLVVTSPVLLRDLFSLLNFKDGIHPVYLP